VQIAAELGLALDIDQPAPARPGRGGLIDIEREAKLGGNLHSKESCKNNLIDNTLYWHS